MKEIADSMKSPLCCLYNAQELQKGMNMSYESRIAMSLICFPVNTTSSKAVMFLSKSQHLINKAACASMDTPICEMPTSRGNIGYTVFLLAVMLLVFSTNLFFCLAMFNSRVLLNNPSHRFFLSQTISDLLMALVVIPMKIDFTIHNQAFCSSEELCDVAYFVDHLIVLSSMLILLTIGIDRYIALSNPYKYQRLMNKRRSVVIIGSIWIVSCMGGIMAGLNPETMRFEGSGIVNQNCVSKRPNYTCAIIFPAFFLPLIIMGFLYYKIFRIAYHHALPIAKMGDFSGSNSSLATRTKPVSCFSNAKLRAMRGIVIVYGTYVICWLPSNVMLILQLWLPEDVHVKKWHFHLFSEILPLSNSVLNIFIYALMNEDCKRAMQKLLMCKIFQRRITKKRFRKENLRRESAKPFNLSVNSSEV